MAIPNKLNYNIKQKRRGSTLIALSLSEIEAAEILINHDLFREAIVHMYFCSFYLSQALLVQKLSNNASHRNVEIMLNKVYGRSLSFPRRYVELHNKLHELRTKFNYKTVHVPKPSLVKNKFRVLKYFVKYAMKILPKLETLEIIKSIYNENEAIIKDFSYDVYCPKTYFHHFRVTYWQPPYYIDNCTPQKLIVHTKALLKKLKIKESEDYVIGLNSKVDQYESNHILMLDIDSLDPIVESELKKLSGILLKSGRGFHFFGKKIIEGQKEWESTLKRIQRNKDLKGNIDKDHLEISLKRGYSTLRITSCPIKPNIPVFYKEL